MSDDAWYAFEVKHFVQSERRLIGALVALVVLLNIPMGWYVLYPLKLFSTWIHEMCHGVAALLIGGSISKVEIFSDGTGLAYTMRPTSLPLWFSSAWVASAGYVGTSVIGALMLFFRRRPRAGRMGLTILGALMVASAVLYIRNGFGFWTTLGLGIALATSGWSLSRGVSGWLYTFVAATCCLNAITSIQVLFSANLVVNGQSAGGSDAHSVADALWLPYWFWASLWIAFGLLVMYLGLRHALPAKAEPSGR